MNDNTIGVLVLIGVVALALFGGARNLNKNGGSPLSKSTHPQTQQSQTSIEKQITEAKSQVEDLKIQIQLEEDKKTQSPYKGLVKIQQVNRSTDPSKEYVAIRMNNSTTTVLVTGWTLKSLSSGMSVTIPKATYLIFAGAINTEDSVILKGGDVAYISTGVSPNGYSFNVNKCSGYMTQFQQFTPYLYISCPLPRDEDLSSIPKTVNNDKCFDYLDSFPSCEIQTGTLPMGLSPECQKFIYEKINYGSCINVHKYDKDFYLNQWRIYLKRSDRLWKDKRENIVLYDNDGKIVDSLTY